MPIGTEDKFRDYAFNDYNSLIQYSGLFSCFEIQKHNIIKNYDELINLAGEEISQDDFVENSFQSITSVSTDPTQQSVLNCLELIKDLVIQGPPGTGKSQTLSAILINALENNKKTIVVCEKNTALEVLQVSLAKAGLEQHSVLIHDISTDRKKVVNSVRTRLQNLTQLKSKYVHSKHIYENQLANINLLVAKINNQHKILDHKLLANYKWTDVVGLFLNNLRRNSGEEVRLSSSIKFEFNYEEYSKLINLIKEGSRLFQEKVKESIVKSFISRENYIAASFYELEDKINECFTEYENIITRIKFLKDELYKEFVDYRLNKVQKQIERILAGVTDINSSGFNLNDVIDNLKSRFLELEQSNLDKDFVRFESKIEFAKKLTDKYSNNIDFNSEERLGSFAFKLRCIISKKSQQTIYDFKQLNSLFDELTYLTKKSEYAPEFITGESISVSTARFRDYYDLLQKLRQQFINSTLDRFKGLDLTYLLKLDTEEKLLEHLDLINNRTTLSSTERIILTELNDWIKTHFTNQRNNYKKLEVLLLESSDFSYDFQFIYNNVDNTNQIQKVYKRINNVESSIRNTIDFEYLNSDIFESEHEFEHLPGFKEIKIKTLELNQKIANDGYVTNYNKQTNLNSLIFKVEDLINQKKQYIDDNPRGFKADYLWYNYINRLDKNAYVLIEELQNHSDWLSSFGISYFNKLLRSYASDDLPTDQYLIDDLIANKVKLQTNQIDFINNIWYNKQNEKVLNFDTANPFLKVKNLYNLKSSTGHRRYSLRYIVEKDIDLFTTFFPIILTTPDVASNLFKYNNRYFDIVLFDEASQLKLEDNVPAMLKGKQIVIAGDEHQMPPSSYFSKIYDGEVESEEDIIDDDSEIKKDKSSIDALALSCSSLLEFGTEMNFKIKSLDFHYRSKHPYLIEFSNYAFYKQKLKAMPKTLEYKPISYVRVNGIFENRVNHIEADRVLDILENNINRKKDNRYPTVGIATFNITQRDLIKAKIVERQKHERYREFSEKIFELEKDGLFIKNLENIQGDERDIIIISTTYGVDTGGGFYERFGPINFEKGYKLLNVIITRARYKNYIVTSIPEDRILNFKSYLVTQQSNNKKAVFYAYLAYAKAVSENNEELRLSVIDALKSNYVLEAYSDYDTDPPLESPFEEEVYERLSQSIDKKFLKPQYKVGGFRIDMVIDFAIPYIPKIAIECDGAKYHSSSEAYLYDTHRQNILESQGFVFHRIWGTNWWRDPDNEFKKLINFIDVQKNIKFDNSEIYNLNQLTFDDIDL